MSVQYTGGGVQYNGGYSVHQGDIMSTVGGGEEIMINVGEGHWENN